MDKKFKLEILLLGISSLVACLIYLIYSYYTNGIGFPLDDAWIHHTFARNFAEKGLWSFQLDEVSGGSTGPVWGFLLSLLYLAKIPAIFGTFILGFLLLWGTAVTGNVIVRKIFPGIKWLPLAAGLMLSLEWHLVWAALSGMETILLILVTLIIFNWLLKRIENWWFIGLLVGFSAWIRPDGLTLAGPVILALVLRGYSPKDIIKYLGYFMGGLIAGGSTYFVFNWFILGEIWPNTFYAKQAEYAILKEVPYILRYLNVSAQFITGVGSLLVPGIVYQIYHSIKNRNWEQVAVFIWSAGYIGLYAWRLPVIYQHGRYIMPAIPISLLLGIAGLASYYDRNQKEISGRLLSRVWIVSTASIMLAFIFFGARSYGMDVAIINTEMVNTAMWVNSHTDEKAVIAAHDIGAMGYFSNRKIIDLAGLITPDVIPFIRDEDRLESYITEEEVDYLVTFPGWYPELVTDLEVLFTSGGTYAPQFGMENMTVYNWK